MTIITTEAILTTDTVAALSSRVVIFGDMMDII